VNVYPRPTWSNLGWAILMLIVVISVAVFWGIVALLAYVLRAVWRLIA
jgi:hypothetical protein